MTGIGYAAFAPCYALTSITIPDSVTYIEHNAFPDSESLNKIIYEGIIEQAKALFASSNLNDSTIIQCTDGNITFSEIME